VFEELKDKVFSLSREELRSRKLPELKNTQTETTKPKELPETINSKKKIENSKSEDI
jgi:hypothetical protein